MELIKEGRLYASEPKFVFIYKSNIHSIFDFIIIFIVFGFILSGSTIINCFLFSISFCSVALQFYPRKNHSS